MQVRLGITLDGHSAGFDTSSRRPLLLVGDGGCGKTTAARFLTRWWLADTGRHAHVYTPSRSEWADFSCAPAPVEQLANVIDADCRDRDCLVVVDDIDLIDDLLVDDKVIDDRRLANLFTSSAPTILTCSSGDRLSGSPLLSTGLCCLGLIRPGQADATQAAVLQGQGRLDWPIGTVTVVIEGRGSADIPRHRWQRTATGTAVGR